MNKIAFRVDANPFIGLGHLMRCLALAQALSSRGHEIVFFSTQETLSFIEQRHDWVGRVRIIPPLDKAEEAYWLAEHAFEFAAFVIDGYQFDSDYRKIVSEQVACLVVLDDLNNSGPLHADLVVNSAADSNELGYELTCEAHTCYCLGSDYRLLRQEFRQFSHVHWNNRNGICISFGGSDPFQHTLSLLKAFVQLQTAIPVTVITGAACAEAEDINQMCLQLPASLTHQHNVQQVSSVFSQSKLAVIAAGGTQFEVLACGTPTILVMVADNQQPATQSAKKQGWCQVVDNVSDSIDYVALANQIVRLYIDDEQLRIMHQAALQHGDSNGALRIAEKIEAIINV